MIPYAPVLAAAFGRPVIVGATREPTQDRLDADLLSDSRLVCLSQTVWQYQWTGVLLWEVVGAEPLLLLPARGAADTPQPITALDAMWAMPIALSDSRFVAAAEAAFIGGPGSNWPRVDLSEKVGAHLQHISSKTAPDWFALIDMWATFTGHQSGDIARPRVIDCTPTDRGWRATIERFWDHDGSTGYHGERVDAELVPGIEWRYIRHVVDAENKRGLAYS